MGVAVGGLDVGVAVAVSSHNDVITNGHGVGVAVTVGPTVDVNFGVAAGVRVGVGVVGSDVGVSVPSRSTDLTHPMSTSVSTLSAVITKIQYRFTKQPPSEQPPWILKLVQLLQRYSGSPEGRLRRKAV